MVLSLAIVALAAPVPLAPGVVVQGGQQVIVPELGVTMTVPAGFSGQLSGEWLLLGNGTVTLAVAAEPGVTVAGVASLLGAPISLDFTTHLVPDGPASVTGNQISVRYGVALAPRKAGQARAVVSPGGIGVAMVAVGPADQPLDAVATNALRTVAFAKAATPAPAPSNQTTPASAGSSGVWTQKLPGRRLAYRYLKNGFRDEWSVDFCSDGTFLYKTSSHSGGSTSMSSRGGYTGRWAITGNALSLRYDDGSTEAAVLTDNGGGSVLWDNTRTSLESNPTCR